MSNNIIVTGASGFIGGRIAYFLATQEYTVLAPIRSGSDVLLPHKNILSTSYDEIGDSSWTNILVRAIIHCAALTTANSNDNDLIFSTNICLGETVANWIGAFSPKKVVYMSTVSVYGRVMESVLRVETSPVNPNPYGLSKLACEAILTQQCVRLGISLSIIRLPGTVGYGSHGNIITKVFGAVLPKQTSTTNTRLTLSNPDSLFNNVVPIDSLLRFVYLLLCKSSLENPLLLTLLASTEPIPFKEVIDYIASSYSMQSADLVDWSESLSPSFSIDCAHAMSHGYNAPSTKKSLDMIRLDICNPPSCL